MNLQVMAISHVAATGRRTDTVAPAFGQHALKSYGGQAKGGAWKFFRTGTMGKLRVRNHAGKIAGFYAFSHDFPQFYAQIRAVFTRFYAFLRVRLVFQETHH